MSDPTWVPGASGSGFGSDHLPFGRWALPSDEVRVGVRVGDFALDAAIALTGTPWEELFTEPTLNRFLEAGTRTWSDVRATLRRIIADADEALRLEPELMPVDDVTMLLPVDVPDYVDFYASLHHAANVGRLFRPDQEPLLPNWRHLPVSYHGRSGTIVPSGTPIVRPRGQRRGPDGPIFGPSESLDIEAELGFVVGVPSELGQRVSVDEFDQHVFGVVGVNDWSARDIQAWEYVPLGPHLGKSFATTISTWITPMEALLAARCELPDQSPDPLPHLRGTDDGGLDVRVSVEIGGHVISQPPYREMYWSPGQMLAHMTSNGASLRTGDLYASGTISGPDRDQRGSLLELSWNGAHPWPSAGADRSFLLDGDEVVLRYQAQGEFGGITLGEVRGTIVPAV
ncbi:fumarylacetoacetase [Microbacterium sp. SSM24]|uniref:fumarylacetoacetase n=1 Tax=Microbacterium sp. SSM24 TaxID=2991714 RepID=UPI002225E35E|nr:fumarylacetoacetase [Microbacterium sp. SSM24]MCW3492631.1 fumarylacetoacetase [Microbacterium sp. SSM24]